MSTSQRSGYMTTRVNCKGEPRDETKDVRMGNVGSDKRGGGVCACFVNERSSRLISETVPQFDSIPQAMLMNSEQCSYKHQSHVFR